MFLRWAIGEISHSFPLLNAGVSSSCQRGMFWKSIFPCKLKKNKNKNKENKEEIFKNN